MIVLMCGTMAYVSERRDEYLIAELTARSWRGDWEELLDAADIGARAYSVGAAIVMATRHAEHTGQGVLIFTYDDEDDEYGIDAIMTDVTGGAEYRELWDVVTPHDVLAAITENP
jgi:hypothetical protein